MVIVFIISCVVISLLVLFMFLIFKKTVAIVNDQTKSYFVNKLQGYDDLINEKENKLNEIDELIKSREEEIKENNEEKIGNKYDFDTDVIDLLSKTKYHDKGVFELNRKIDENFVIDYDALVKDFVNFAKGDNRFNFCKRLKRKFKSDVIYDIKCASNQDKIVRELLNDEEYKIYELFKSVSANTSIDNFIDYLDQLVSLNDPTIRVMVGRKDENYNKYGKNVKTIYDSSIYRGIKIMYKNRVYDFSISERNE